MTRARQSSPTMERRRASDGILGVPPTSSRSFPSDSGEQPLFRLNLRRSLQMYGWLTFGIILVCLALAVVQGAKKWPTYIAESQVFVQPAPSRVLTQGTSERWPSNPTTYESFMEQQVQSAAHPEVLLSAMRKLSPGSWQQKGESEESAAARLGGAIEVARVGTSYQILITAKASNGELAAKIANAMAASIVESAANDETAGDAQRLAILREERDRVQKELTSDRAEQESLNAKLGMAAIGATVPNYYDDDISKVREELVKARAAHDEVAARLASLSDNNATNSAAMAAEADEAAISDPGLSSMKSALNQKRAALIARMANLKPNHPEYKQDEEELAKIDASLETTTKDLRTNVSSRIRQRLRTDLARTSDIEGRLNAQLGQLTGAAASATPKLQRANDLAADIVRLQNRLATVEEQLRNLILESGAPSAAHLSSAAVVPQFPATNAILKSSMKLVLVGIILGILAALIANNLDPRVYTADDVEHVLRIVPMAQLPNFDEVSEGAAEEHLLRLAMTIDHARQLGNLKSCIFTGTGPGVGVTTVSSRVRTMLESMGRSPVLIDVSGTPTPSDTFVETASQSTFGLATQRESSPIALRQQLAEGMKGENSLVLTDTAPLPLSAETENLARYVDAAIIVIQSGVTTRAQLREAADNLQRLNVSAVGFVLNRIKLKTADPSFRQSVKAMEKLLAVQGRANRRHTDLNEFFTDEPSTDGAQVPEKSDEFAPAAPVPSNESANAEVASSAVPEQRAEVREVPTQEPQETGATPEMQEPKPTEAPSSAPESKPEESKVNTPSQPDGYRVEAFSNVLMNVQMRIDEAEKAARDVPKIAPAPERPAVVRPVAQEPIPVPLQRTSVDDSPARVTAAPEFLPPQSADNEDEEDSSRSAGRRDRRNVYDDDVRILPSSRGQYR
jgi:succinoglycan biosynthesis transport protein ExoP